MREVVFMRDVNPNRSVKAGFRRLWLVISVIWLVGLLASTFDHYDAVKLFLLAGLLPVAAVYAIFAGLAWVIAGFRSR
jgi:hypothetical protein